MFNGNTHTVHVPVAARCRYCPCGPRGECGRGTGGLPRIFCISKVWNGAFWCILGVFWHCFLDLSLYYTHWIKIKQSCFKIYSWSAGTLQSDSILYTLHKNKTVLFQNLFLVSWYIKSQIPFLSRRRLHPQYPSPSSSPCNNLAGAPPPPQP